MSDRSRGETTYAYVNRERTHEVLALAELGAVDARWMVAERPYGSTDPSDALVHESTTSAAAVPGLVRDLEERLAASGAYFRVDEASRALVPLTAALALDLRAHSVPIPEAPDGAFLEYFHFHNHAGPSRVVLTMPREPARPDGDRFVLAHYDYDANSPKRGELEVVHPRLAGELVVGRVVGDHIELPRAGYRKLYEPVEYEAALGTDWRAKTSRAIESAATALSIPTLRPALVAPPPPAPTRAPPLPPATAQAALRSDAYRALRDRFLPGPDAERVISGGMHAIRRFVQLARRTASHTDQVRISLLEAGLAVEYGLRSANPTLVNENGPQLLRLVRSLPQDA